MCVGFSGQGQKIQTNYDTKSDMSSGSERREQMDVIAELIANVVLALGIFLVQWCIRHKNITLAILALIMIAIDVVVLLKMVKA